MTKNISILRDRHGRARVGGDTAGANLLWNLYLQSSTGTMSVRRMYFACGSEQSLFMANIAELFREESDPSRIMIYSGGHQHLQRSKSSISLSNVALNENPGTVLETARPEDSKTPPTC